MDRRFEHAHRMSTQELRKCGIRSYQRRIVAPMARPMSMLELDAIRLRDYRKQRDANKPSVARVEMAHPHNLRELVKFP
nr:hypothetical protein [Candidatus Levybacteria bacterium]